MSLATRPLAPTVPNDLEAFFVPFTPNRAFKKAPRLIARAKGMHYYTPEGKPIIDGSAGMWCCNAGHNRDPIVAAIQQQAAELDYPLAFLFSHPKAFELASRVAALAPGELDHVFFCNSGSEAVDTALKIALAYHKARGEGARTRFIGRERGYHGIGFGGISVGGMGPNRKQFGNMLAGVDHLQTTYDRSKQAFTKGEPEWGAHLADELTRLVNLHDASTIAAVIVDPLAAAAGLATLDIYKDEGLFERAAKLEPVFADAMMSLKGEPNVEDIRTVGLLAGIDLAPIPGKPGLRGYEATERMYHDHDIYVRVAMDTLIVAPPLISSEADIADIRDRIAKVLKAVA